VDHEDQGDHKPPWWTRTGFYILLMQQIRITAFTLYNRTSNGVGKKASSSRGSGRGKDFVL